MLNASHMCIENGHNIVIEFNHSENYYIGFVADHQLLLVKDRDFVCLFVCLYEVCLHTLGVAYAHKSSEAEGRAIECGTAEFQKKKLVLPAPWQYIVRSFVCLSVYLFECK